MSRRIRMERVRGLQDSAGLLAWRPQASGLPIRLASEDPAGQWLARRWRRLTVARRRRLHTVFPIAELAVNVERGSGAASRAPRCNLAWTILGGDASRACARLVSSPGNTWLNCASFRGRNPIYLQRLVSELKLRPPKNNCHNLRGMTLVIVNYSVLPLIRTRGRPVGAVSISSGVSNTCSRSSRW